MRYQTFRKVASSKKRASAYAVRPFWLLTHFAWLHISNVFGDIGQNATPFSRCCKGRGLFSRISGAAPGSCPVHIPGSTLPHGGHHPRGDWLPSDLGPQGAPPPQYSQHGHHHQQAQKEHRTYDQQTNTNHPAGERIREIVQNITFLACEACHPLSCP